MLSQTPKVGDVLNGGIVFFVSEAKDSVLICGKNDAAQYCDWPTAKSRCEGFFSIKDGQLLNGWRMPTKEEMAILREKRDIINDVIQTKGGQALTSDVGAYYWTSSEGEHDSQAWLQAFGFTHQTLSNKGSNSFNARAVQFVKVTP